MEQSPADDWSRLPADILVRITRDAGNSPAEIVAFRSVCQGWRLSIPLPPNKLSVIFPLDSLVYPVKLEQKDGSYLGCRIEFVFYASAVYLVRPRSDPSGPACLVSVEESSPGHLVLRDPLVFRKVFTSSPPIDPDWIVATQTLISRSFASYKICPDCDTIRWTDHMVYVPYSAFGCRGLVGVFKSFLGYWVFKMDLIGNTTTSSSSATRHRLHNDLEIGGDDLVAFNGHIIVVDGKGRIYVLDHTSLKLIHLNSVTMPQHDKEQHFVVSDGDLYLVVLGRVCETYRLVINADDHHEDGSTAPISSLVVEQVEDLGGDRVFFLTLNGSFSVSARDLPLPWKGNCVVVRFIPLSICECKSYPTCKLKHEIFFLGGGQKPRSATISSLPGYSDLLSPGDLLVKIKDLDLGQDADIVKSRRDQSLFFYSTALASEVILAKSFKLFLALVFFTLIYSCSGGL